MLVCKLALYNSTRIEGKERPRREAGHSKWVGGKINKQGNFPRSLCPSSHRMSRSLYHSPESQNLYRSFNWVQSHILPQWSLQHLTLSRLRTGKWLLAENHYFPSTDMRGSCLEFRVSDSSQPLQSESEYDKVSILVVCASKFGKHSAVRAGVLPCAFLDVICLFQILTWGCNSTDPEKNINQ